MSPTSSPTDGSYCAIIWVISERALVSRRGTLERRFPVGGRVPDKLGSQAQPDNPDRLRSEAAFAHLCGVAPIPASSGKTNRHRLHRGGDRAGNSALHIAAVVRLRYDPRNRAYADRRTAEGLSMPEIIRCQKRYLAREIFHALCADYAKLST